MMITNITSLNLKTRTFSELSVNHARKKIPPKTNKKRFLFKIVIDIRKKRKYRAADNIGRPVISVVR